MTDKQTPPDWAFERACGWVGRKPHHDRSMAVDNPERRAISALCDMIERYEEPPLDPAVEALIEALIDLTDGRSGASTESYAKCLRAALADRAFEIRESGYGK